MMKENNGDIAIMKPAWIDGLIGETFFASCGYHETFRKNEKNIFCLDCLLSFCPHCLPSHHSHTFIQVRRYVYHDVVRLDDLEKLIDCSYIKPYTINHAKVIFLNQREQSKTCKGSSSNNCFNCDRILQEPFNFCSLSCKVGYMVHQGEDLSSINLYDHSTLSFTQFEGLKMDGGRLDYVTDDDDGQNSTDSIIENPLQFKSSSCSSDTLISEYPNISKKKNISLALFSPLAIEEKERHIGLPYLKRILRIRLQSTR